MADISQEINFPVRTSPMTGAVAVGSEVTRIEKRYRRAHEIMANYCAPRGITEDDLRSKSQLFQAVARRRRYARLCKAAGIGRCIIASMLHVDGSTVAAYLNPGIIEKKAATQRARRLAQKAIVTLPEVCQ